VANLFAVVGIMAAGLLIVTCWLEARGRARYNDGEHRRQTDGTGAEQRVR
jgi:hypothetical protein